jgi:hypothetical protein
LIQRSARRQKNLKNTDQIAGTPFSTPDKTIGRKFSLFSKKSNCLRRSGLIMIKILKIRVVNINIRTRTADDLVKIREFFNGPALSQLKQLVEKL